MGGTISQLNFDAFYTRSRNIGFGDEPADGIDIAVPR